MAEEESKHDTNHRLHSASINGTRAIDSQAESTPMNMRLDPYNDPPVIGERLLSGRARAGTLPSSWNQAPRSSTNINANPERGPHGASRLAFAIREPTSDDASSTVLPPRPLSSHPNVQRWRQASGSVPGTPAELAGNESHSAAFGPPFRALSTSKRPMTLLRQVSSTSSSDHGRVSPTIPTPIGTSAAFPFATSYDAGTSSTGMGSGEATLRSRSGSNSSALANSAFGPSIFTSTWVDRNTGMGNTAGTESSTSRRSSILAPSSRPDSKTSFGFEHATSTSASHDKEWEQDEHNLDPSQGAQTLNYLGIEHDEDVSGRFSAPQRNRASTLASIPPDLRNRSPLENHPSARPSGLEPDANWRDMFASQPMTSGPPGAIGRNRAGTVAALGGPGGRQRAERELLRMATAGNLSGLTETEMSSLIASLDGLGIGHSSAPLEGFPHMDVSTPPPLSTRQSPFPTQPPTPTLLKARSASAFDEVPFASQPHIPTSRQPSQQMTRDNSQWSNMSSLNQTPSRSLWIGNLDASTTGQELMHVFAPYGAIESLRLLPEKECGFVNFIEMADAIRAREDVLGRLGGRLDNLGSGPGGRVRIGFGKIDATPGQITPAHGDLRGPTTEHTMQEDATESGLPTRALWVGSIAGTATPNTLLSIFQPFGPIESARILSHKNCGFINFERVDDAVRARKMLNGRDVLGSEVGAMRIGFAKVPTRNPEQYPANGSDTEQAVENLAQLKGNKNVSLTAEEQVLSGSLENYRSNLVVSLLNEKQRRPSSQHRAPAAQDPPANGPRAAATSSSASIVPASDKGGVPLPSHMAPRATVTDLQLIMRLLSANDQDADADEAKVASYRPSSTYYITLPLVTEVSSGRRFETARLREARRNIESGHMTQPLTDKLALEYLEWIVDLSSDYIGNTLVQKFFEVCSEEVKYEMLQRLAPHLAIIGCHKNGTWAAQKILDCTTSPEHIRLIGQHLRPYIPGLLLNEFGNYVVQCCLPWASHNTFVFDAMVDRCWEVAQGRYGARSMRACLESAHTSQYDRKRVAIAIILNSVPLATSSNGAILLSWLLETSGLSSSYKLLAPRLAPHLAHLCTHKVASPTVLRLVTQTLEPSASAVILHALFENGEDSAHVLEEVIVDQVHGSQFITKVLSSPALDAAKRDQYTERIKTLLNKHALVGVPAYRRLSEDLGLVYSSVPGPMTGRPGSTNVAGLSGSARFSAQSADMSIPAASAYGVNPTQLARPNSQYPKSHQRLPPQPSKGPMPPVVPPSIHAVSPDASQALQDQFNPFWSPPAMHYTPPSNRR